MAAYSMYRRSFWSMSHTDRSSVLSCGQKVDLQNSKPRLYGRLRIINQRTLILSSDQRGFFDDIPRLPSSNCILANRPVSRTTTNVPRGNAGNNFDRQPGSLRWTLTPVITRCMPVVSAGCSWHCIGCRSGCGGKADILCEHEAGSSVLQAYR